jgi:hypothetical protein
MVFIPPLITVWLQVRVLPGPPTKSINHPFFDFSASRFSSTTNPTTATFLLRPFDVIGVYPGAKRGRLPE